MFLRVRRALEFSHGLGPEPCGRRIASHIQGIHHQPGGEGGGHRLADDPTAARINPLGRESPPRSECR